MTDVVAALGLLAESDLPERGQALADFYARWRDDALVVDKWFALQAMAQRPDAIDVVTGLLGHEAFTLANPNRVRALIGAFAKPTRPASTARTAPATRWSPTTCCSSTRATRRSPRASPSRSAAGAATTCPPGADAQPARAHPRRPQPLARRLRDRQHAAPAAIASFARQVPLHDPSSRSCQSLMASSSICQCRFARGWRHDENREMYL